MEPSSGDPEVFPGPPPNILSRKISLAEFKGSLFRTHSITRNPLYFGKSRLHRFDAPDGSYKVLYAGCDPFCAFIESLAKAAGTRVITTTELKNKALAEIKPARPLRLIDLTQSGTLVRIGADSRLFSGEHGTAQLWSKALHDHPIAADGLLYPSRLDPVRHAAVLFEDRAPKLKELSRQSWYAPGPQRHLLAQVVEHYDLELIENHFVVARKPVSKARQEGLF
jgi:RES domain